MIVTPSFAPCFNRSSIEFIPIYGPRGLRGKEAPALASGPCTGLQSCPPAMQSATQEQLEARARYTEDMLIKTLAAIKATAEG